MRRCFLIETLIDKCENLYLSVCDSIKNILQQFALVGHSFLGHVTIITSKQC